MKSLARGDTRMNDMARQFALSSRTLQRRLACEGASYRQLLEDARKDAAGRYAFHRAFRRWYGMTPEMFRRRTEKR